jgi:hypothetical protein
LAARNTVGGVSDSGDDLRQFVVEEGVVLPVVETKVGFEEAKPSEPFDEGVHTLCMVLVGRIWRAGKVCKFCKDLGKMVNRIPLQFL